ncbi:MAG: hypothetical protein IIY06_09490 [Proteobacteria bacterium]|nr:hypothetical protein [Pseudomonadota bacterium]
MWIDDPFYDATLPPRSFVWPCGIRYLHRDAEVEELVLTKEVYGFGLTFSNMAAKINATASGAEVRFDRACSHPMPEAYHRARVLFPIMRLLRGELAFHASCVSMQDRAVVFMAPSGVGKTTAAAALVAYAFAKIVADDTTIVSLTSDGYVALPGSTAFAMRHCLLDDASCFGEGSVCGIKRMLPVKSTHVAKHRILIDRVIFLEPGGGKLEALSLSARPSRFLSQQFILSEAPLDYRHEMFTACVNFMSHIPAYTLGIDGKTSLSLRQFAENFSS